MIVASRWLRKRLFPRILSDELVEWLTRHKDDATHAAVVSLIDVYRKLDGKVPKWDLTLSQVLMPGSNAIPPAIAGEQGKPYFPQLALVYMLAGEGWLHMVRQCHCGKWFGFNRRADAKTCSIKCHQEAWERSQKAMPRFKEENRIYQQWHRAKRAKKTRLNSAQFMKLSESARREICKRRKK